VGVEFNQTVRDRQRLVQGDDSGRGVAKVGFVRAAEQQTHLAVGLHAVEFERGVVRVASQAVEVLHGLGDGLALRVGRAGNVLQLHEVVEEQKVRQGALLVDAALREPRLGARHGGLPAHQQQARGKHDGDAGRDRDEQPIAPEKAPGAVAPGRMPGRHGPLRHGLSEVVSQGVRAGVAFLDNRMRRLEHDRIEILRGLGVEPEGRRIALPDLGRRLKEIARLIARRAGYGGNLREAACDQPVEHHAKGIDVRGGGDCISADVFGAGVAERHGTHPRLRHLTVQAGRRTEQLQRAEVEQLDDALAGHHHVGGLEVAMQDEVAMDIRDGLAELQHQAQLVVQQQRRIFEDAVEPFALDVLHCDVGHAFRGHPGVEQARDVLMLQPRQRVAFEVEVAHCRAGAEVARDQLDGDALRKAARHPAAEVDDAHAAAAEFALQGERPKHAAKPGINRFEHLRTIEQLLCSRGSGSQ
jgi:hypothetical protein